MTGYKIPIFQRGGLLTQEMLDVMKQYMTGIAVCSYEGYSDGILSGMQIKVSEGIITIGRGLIKYGDALLVMQECVTVPIPEHNELQLVKLCIHDKEIGAEFETIEMDIVVDNRIEKKRNEIEICRMHLQHGARLRSDYESFQDMNTTYDTIQVIDADWAAYKRAGIHPQVLEQFAKEAGKIQRKEAADICFLQQIFGTGGYSCPRDLIEFYLSEKLGKKQDEYTNQELYQGLCNVLQQLKTGDRVRERPKGTRRMIVD